MDFIRDGMFCVLTHLFNSCPWLLFNVQNSHIKIITYLVGQPSKGNTSRADVLEGNEDEGLGSQRRFYVLCLRLIVIKVVGCGAVDISCITVFSLLQKSTVRKFVFFCATNSLWCNSQMYSESNMELNLWIEEVYIYSDRTALVATWGFTVQF